MQMKIGIEKYTDAVLTLPAAGQYIVAHQTQTQLVVYQAYKPSIAAFAVEHQHLGGPAFSYERMSWIKPNFLWMMYRCGWASKENQERVLALWLDKAAFEEILGQAVFSSYSARHYASPEAWRTMLNESEVRLQWDPDHDPYGMKLTRRAVQLGLKGAALRRFGEQQISQIEDITDFVHQQRGHLELHQLDKLYVPEERVYNVVTTDLAGRIGIV